MSHAPSGGRARVVGLAKAEWIKLVSTRQLQLLTGLAVGLSVLIAVLLGAAMGQYNGVCARPEKHCRMGPMKMDNTIATAGILGDGTPGAGLIVLMLLGAMCVLIELRYGTLATTYFATPAREWVIGVKAAMSFGIAFVVTAIAALLSAMAFSAVAGSAADEVQLWSAGMASVCLRTALVVAFAAAAAVGLAAAVQRPIAVVALLLLWPLLIEPMLPSLVPQVGEQVARYMPFTNARAFIGLETEAHPPWGAGVAGLYFALLSVALLAIGVLVARTQDLRQQA